jgi:hypothetical protein
MQIRILGSDLPGLACAGSGDFPGYENIPDARANSDDEANGSLPAPAIFKALAAAVAPNNGP